MEGSRMKDAELDALIAAHRESGDMRGFARAVADAAYGRAASLCDAIALDAQAKDTGRSDEMGPFTIAITATEIGSEIRELRSER